MYNIRFYEKIKDIFDLNGRFGGTGYIDFLTNEEVPKNIMKGVDRCHRKFITLKMGVMDCSTGKFIKKRQVFFQRYTNGTVWMGANFSGNFIWTDGGINDIQFQLINDIVDGKTVFIKDEHRPVVYSDVDCVVANMDVWENKFAKVIQRAFMVSRYNPGYQLCKKILNKQYNDHVRKIKGLKSHILNNEEYKYNEVFLDNNECVDNEKIIESFEKNNWFDLNIFSFGWLIILILLTYQIIL